MVKTQYISKEEFLKINIGFKLKIRYMLGIAIVNEVNTEDMSVMVTFDGGPWDGEEVELVRQQIKEILWEH